MRIMSLQKSFFIGLQPLCLGRSFKRLQFKLRHKQIRPAYLYGWWYSTISPVLDSLRSPSLVITKELGDFSHASKAFNQVSVVI